MKIVVVGGGAAGFFAAIHAKKRYPQASVTLYEKTRKLLSKVRISGGGRCNVTHACFDPKQLVANYPRGAKELLGPFHRFQPKDTMEWFSERGVALKIEEDGRVFPVTDSSETIIEALIQEAEKEKVEIILGSSFDIQHHAVDRLILATGSAKEGLLMARSMGHTIQEQVPSLFTFNIPQFSLESLSGISFDKVHLRLEGSNLQQEGPLLITHWGFSGPACLKLSAFGARFLAEKKYETGLIIDWLPDFSIDQIVQMILQEAPSKKLKNISSIPLPKRAWELLSSYPEEIIARLSKKRVYELCQKLKSDRYQIQGKTTHKEEFVTCGGITLSEVDFKTMESKIRPGLYFCGEILDIDGVTGGFNLQNAWTTGWIAGNA